MPEMTYVTPESWQQQQTSRKERRADPDRIKRNPNRGIEQWYINRAADVAGGATLRSSQTEIADRAAAASGEAQAQAAAQAAQLGGMQLASGGQQSGAFEEAQAKTAQAASDVGAQAYAAEAGSDVQRAAQERSVAMAQGNLAAKAADARHRMNAKLAAQLTEEIIKLAASIGTSVAGGAGAGAAAAAV